MNENVGIVVEYSAEMLKDYALEVKGKGKSKSEWFVDAIRRKCKVDEAEAKKIADELCEGIAAYRQEALAARQEPTGTFMTRMKISDKDRDLLLEQVDIEAEKTLNDLDDAKAQGGK